MKKSYSKKKTSVSRKIFRVFNTLFMSFLIMSIILPFMSIVTKSLINRSINGLTLLPIYENKFRIDNIAYYTIFKYEFFSKPLLVSLSTTVFVTVFGLLITSISAYLLVQKDMPGIKIFSYMILIMLVYDTGIVPFFIVMKKLELLNSLWAVMIPLIINAYNIILMRNFFEGLPRDILDSAEIDGCTPVQTFINIVLPMSKAVLAAIGFFFAAAAWNEYFGYVVFISSAFKQNFTYRMRDWPADYCVPPEWMENGAFDYKTMQAAMIIVNALPIIILSLFAQKFYTPEFTMASVKE